ncbi:PEP-CTERM sorting domain-containing protein [Massilia sp. S19_KUP03_FR1]|uniref:PEP-CTERM sorting domain-containing protein n=1 Tax=Massilia sp. S19_KUP03_FR1 TaxID=3025503 RepID=UPI002FCD5B59
MLLRSLHKLLIGLSVFACTSVFATPITFDVRGIQSYGQLGAPQNPVFLLDVGANATVTGIAYNVNLTAFDPSWLSEVTLTYTDSIRSVGGNLAPAFNVDASATGMYSRLVNLLAQNLSFSVGADGILRLEFSEFFDDEKVTPDGIWNFGSVTFYFAGDPVPASDVPEPGSALLLGAGLAMMGYCGRRRRAGMQAAA